MDQKRVLCQTPTPGKQGVRILAWKYDLIRQVILSLLPQGGDAIAFRDLPTMVAQALTAEQRQALGSVSWYTTTVKLDLEVRREIERVPGTSPQHLRRI